MAVLEGDEEALESDFDENISPSISVLLQRKRSDRE
jgi:hypothetical protein